MCCRHLPAASRLSIGADLSLRSASQPRTSSSRAAFWSTSSRRRATPSRQASSAVSSVRACSSSLLEDALAPPPSSPRPLCSAELTLRLARCAQVQLYLRLVRSGQQLGQGVLHRGASPPSRSLKALPRRPRIGLTLRSHETGRRARRLDPRPAAPRDRGVRQPAGLPDGALGRRRDRVGPRDAHPQQDPRGGASLRLSLAYLSAVPRRWSMR